MAVSEDRQRAKWRPGSGQGRAATIASTRAEARSGGVLTGRTSTMLCAFVQSPGRREACRLSPAERATCTGCGSSTSRAGIRPAFVAERCSGRCWPWPSASCSPLTRCATGKSSSPRSSSPSARFRCSEAWLVFGGSSPHGRRDRAGPTPWRLAFSLGLISWALTDIIYLIAEARGSALLEFPSIVDVPNYASAVFWTAGVWLLYEGVVDDFLDEVKEKLVFPDADRPALFLRPDHRRGQRLRATPLVRARPRQAGDGGRAAANLGVNGFLLFRAARGRLGARLRPARPALQALALGLTLAAVSDLLFAVRRIAPGAGSRPPPGLSQRGRGGSGGAGLLSAAGLRPAAIPTRHPAL